MDEKTTISRTSPVETHPRQYTLVAVMTKHLLLLDALKAMTQEERSAGGEEA